MPDANAPFRTEFLPTPGDMPAGLWAACFPPPLEGAFWYEALHASGLEDQFSFHYGLIRSGDIPVGIAPAFLHDVPISLVAPRPVAAVLRILSHWFPQAAIQRTFFVGSPCSDEGTVGLVPGVTLEQVGKSLLEAVRAKARRRGAPMVVFKDFAEKDLRCLEALSSGRGFFTIPSYPGTSLSLPPGGKDAYLKSLAHTQRHNLLKKLRRSRERLELDTAVVERPGDAELSEILGLFLQTYERGKTKFERLDRRFFEQIRGRREARFILQRDRANGNLVSFMLIFVLGGRVINKFIGIDYRRAEGTYLYFRLFDAALDFAYGIGAEQVQSGQTGYRAKLDLGHGLVPLFNVCRHRNAVVNSVFRAIGGRLSWRTLDSDLEAYLRAHPGMDRSRGGPGGLPSGH